MKNTNAARLIKSAFMEALKDTADTWRKEERLKENSFTRERKLPLRTMLLFLVTMKGGTLDKELHDAGIDVSKQSFSKRREQIPPRKGASKGYNQLHANPLYDVVDKVYLDAVIQPQPKQDEIGALLQMLKRNTFPEKSVIVADRGYESYNVIAHFLAESGVYFLIRLKQNRSAMRDIQSLPMEESDRDLAVTVTTTQTKADKENGYVWIQTHRNADRKYSGRTRGARWDFGSPYKLSFRAVRIRLEESGEYETLATNLPREDFTPEDIKELYHMRWGIETSFRALKYDIGLTHLHGKSERYAKQEIYAAMIFYNLVSRIISAAETEPGRAVNRARASDLCRDFLRKNKAGGVKLLKEIEKHTEPVRPGRQDKRTLQAKGFAGFAYRVP